MNPPESTTVAGELVTTWHRFETATIVFAAITIVQPVAKGAPLRRLTDPRLLPAQCRLFRRSRVLVARGHVKCSPDNNLGLSGKLLNRGEISLKESSCSDQREGHKGKHDKKQFRMLKLVR